ncbi:MAG: hypothetical protein FE048_03945 [Thermoplasmata archaeon]|nr:MAG: hypothetical protein FE048_03945 [Thermoplasmata archaeon]
MIQAFIKFGIILIILASIAFFSLYFLGFLLPIAIIVGGMLILSIIFFSVIFAILAILLAIYYAITKKPKIERDGDWSLERIKGKGD